MASKTVVTYICDTCGKEEQQMDPSTPVSILGFRVQPVLPRIKIGNTKTVEVHYHPECVPGGIKVLLEGTPKGTAA